MWGCFMGWTCQHDYQGYCKRVEKPCIPGMKGCTLKGDFIFSTKPQKDEEKEEIDFAALARSN
jgi:hypothetical protein